MNKDLTVGKPGHVLWRFCLPLLGSVVFQQLYNIADSLVAGRYAGQEALAAVGNSYEITLIYLAFAFGCNMGCSVIVSQLFGAGNYRDMKTAVSTTFISSALVCALLMVLGFTCGSGLLQMIHTPEDIFADSRLYLDIYTGGLLFLFFYNIATGIFSALGDSATPFLFLAASSVANVFADILFVKYFHMDVAGVAWATFICQGVSCVLSIAVVIKRLAAIDHDMNGEEDKVPLFSFGIYKKMLRIAIPSTLQQSFISVGNIMIQGIINGFGSSVIAGYSAAIKLNNMVITTYTAMGNGMSNFSAQNIGAGKNRRIGQGFRAGLKLVFCLSVLIVAVYMLLCGPLVNLFMDSKAGDALDVGVQFLRIVAPFYFLVSVKITCDGVLRGTGSMKQFMASTFSDLILRVSLAFIFSAKWGAKGIWCAWPVGWTVGMVLSVVFYMMLKKRLDRPKADVSIT